MPTKTKRRSHRTPPPSIQKSNNPSPKGRLAWLRQQIAAAAGQASHEQRILHAALANQQHLACSNAISNIARRQHGQPLRFPSQALPPLH